MGPIPLVGLTLIWFIWGTKTSTSHQLSVGERPPSFIWQERPIPYNSEKHYYYYDYDYDDDDDDDDYYYYYYYCGSVFPIVGLGLGPLLGKKLNRA